MKLSHIALTALFSTAAATSFASSVQNQPSPNSPNTPVIVSTDESVETSTLGTTTTAPTTAAPTPSTTSPDADTGASEIAAPVKGK